MSNWTPKHCARECITNRLAPSARVITHAQKRFDAATNDPIRRMTVQEEWFEYITEVVIKERLSDKLEPNAYLCPFILKAREIHAQFLEQFIECINDREAEPTSIVYEIGGQVALDLIRLSR